LIHESAKIDPSSKIGPNVVIGKDCVIGPGCKIYNSTILSDTKVLGYSLIQGSIIGWGNTIGQWCRIDGLSVTGEDVQLKDETFLNGTFVLPHKGITGNYPAPGTIIM